MIMIAVAAMLAGVSEADLRQSFTECLNTAMSQALTQKVTADGFVAFAQTACTASAEPFKAALAKTNVSHGMGRKEAESDAATQVSDYYSERLENYKFKLQPLPAKSAGKVD